MAVHWARDRATLFYVSMGLVGLTAVAIGFSTTYFAPMARREFDAPVTVHLHGALALGWVLLFIGQSWLVRSNRTGRHRALGKFGIPLALAVLFSGIATALWAAERDSPKFGDEALGGITGTATSLTMFTGLVIAAVLMRRRADWHKRLMLLSIIVVLWPAYFRFRHVLPFIPRPEISLALILADLSILIAAVRDKILYGRIHPAWKWVGSAVFLEQLLEVWLFGSPFWNGFGRLLYTSLR